MTKIACAFSAQRPQLFQRARSTLACAGLIGDVGQTKMKIASVSVLLCFAWAWIPQAVASDGIDAEWQLIRAIASLSEVGDYERIYEMLGSQYRRTVPKETFLKASKEAGWILIKPRMGTIQGGNQTSYAPVRGSVRTRLKIHEIDAVVFFVKEEAGWKFRNFPFLPEHLPNWAEIPSWLE